MSLANPMPTIQKGAIGVVFIFTACDGNGKVIDISTATLLEAYFFKPVTRTSITRTGVLHTDGKDGKFRYVSIAGDLDEAHDFWRRQGRVEVPGLGNFPTIQRQFPIKDNIV